MTSGKGVRSFYERNTRLFLAFGGGRRSGAIHREVWGEGVTSREEAFSFVNKLMADRLADSFHGRKVPVRVMDLGCGVGGSLIYLGKHLPFEIDAVGITVSPTQVRLARQRWLSMLDFKGRCRFLEADFNALPDLGVFDGMFSIEAFIHGRLPATFFSEVSRNLEKDGRLFIVDDFLETEAENEWIARFRSEWSTGSLMTVRRATALAEQAGLRCIENVDLTPYLRLERMRDRVIRQVMKMPMIQQMNGAYKRGLSGGDALQKCLKKGWIRFRLLGFKPV